MRTVGLLVHPVSLDSLVWALGVVVIIGDRLVNWGTPLGSLGSSWVIGFIGVRPGGRQIHPGSLGCSLGIVGFIRCRWVHFGSSGIAGFIEMLPVNRRVHPGYLGSLVSALRVVVFIRGHTCRPWRSPGSSGFTGYIWERAGGFWVPSGSPSSLGCTLGVVGIIRRRLVFGVCPGSRRVRPVSLGSFRCALMV